MPSKKSKKKSSRMGDGLRGYATVSTPRKIDATDGVFQEDSLLECELRVQPGGLVALSVIPAASSAALDPDTTSGTATRSAVENSPSPSPAALRGECLAVAGPRQRSTGKSKKIVTYESSEAAHSAELQKRRACGSSSAPQPKQQPLTGLSGCEGGVHDEEADIFPCELASCAPVETLALSGEQSRRHSASSSPVSSAAAGYPSNAGMSSFRAAEAGSHETVEAISALPELASRSQPIPVPAPARAARSLREAAGGLENEMHGGYSAPVGSPWTMSRPSAPKGSSAWTTAAAGAAGSSPATRLKSSQPIAVPASARGQSADGSSAVSLASSAPATMTRAAWPLPHEAAAADDAALAAALALSLEDASDDAGEEGIMCAICHNSIKPMEVALVRGCDHPFCCNCILNWAKQKKKCPLCNTDFTHLWLYKLLDGTLNDYLAEENVDLLLCASWFRKAVVTEFSPQPEHDESDEYHEMLQDVYGGGDVGDEEAYYYDMLEGMSQGRLGRRAVGNRLWGNGGVVQGGRRAARAMPRTPCPPSKKNAAGTPSSSGGSSHGAVGSGSSDRNSAEGYSRKAEIRAQKAAQRESQKIRRRAMVGADVY